MSVYRFEFVYSNPFFNSPNAPCVKEFGPKYVVVYFTCNDSDAIIESIMKKTKFYEECRACMGNPKMMEMEPAWIRMGMTHLLTKELSGINVDE